MKNDEKSGEGGSIKNPVLRGIVNCILYTLAVLQYLFVDSAKYLHRKVYQEDWQSSWHWLVGVFLAVQVAMNGGFVHVPASFSGLNVALSAIATYLYLWPGFYWGSHLLWKNVDEYRQGRWFRYLLTTIAYISMIFGALALAKAVIVTFAAHPISLGLFVVAAEAIGWVLGIVAFCIVCGIVGGVLFFWSQDYVASITGLGFVYAIAPHLAGIAARAGLTATDAHVLEWAFWVAYLFPMVTIFATRSLGWVKTGVVWLKKKAYVEDQAVYGKFFEQAINIGLSTYWTYLCTGLWDRMGMVPAAACVLSALVFCFLYVVLGDFMEKEANNRVAGAVTSGLSMAFVYQHHDAGFLGTYGGIVAAVTVGVLVYNAAYPLSYLAVRLIANPLLASWLGEPLFKLHQQASQGFSKLMRRLSDIIDTTYSNKTTFRGIFMHALNPVVAGFVFGATHAGHGYALATLGALGSYVVLGGLMLWTGPLLLGAGATIYAGAETYNRVHATLPTEPWTSGFLGFLMAGLTLLVFIPLLYAGLQAVATRLSAEHLTEILSFISAPYVWLTDKIKVVWNAFLPYLRSFFVALARAKAAIAAAVKAVWQMVQPRLKKLEAAIREAQQAIQETLDKLRHRKTTPQHQLSEPPAHAPENVEDVHLGTAIVIEGVKAPEGTATGTQGVKIPEVTATEIDMTKYGAEMRRDVAQDMKELEPEAKKKLMDRFKDAIESGEIKVPEKRKPDETGKSPEGTTAGTEGVKAPEGASTPPETGKAPEGTDNTNK